MAEYANIKSNLMASISDSLCSYKYISRKERRKGGETHLSLEAAKSLDKMGTKDFRILLVDAYRAFRPFKSQDVDSMMTKLVYCGLK